MRKLGKLPFLTIFLAFVWVVCFTAELGSLAKINYREEKGRVLVEFKGTQRLRYRVKEYQSPPHLLVQFFNTRSSLPYDKVQVDKGNVTHLTLRELAVNGETATFVSVHLNYNSEFDFDLSADGMEFQLRVKSTHSGGGAKSAGGREYSVDIGEIAEEYVYREETGEGLPPVIQIPGEKSDTKQIPYSYIEGEPGEEVEIPYRVKEDDTSPYIVGPVILQDADISQTIRLLSEAAGGANIVVEASLVGQRRSGGGITVTLSHITLEDALDIITSSNNWTWRKYGDYYSIMSKDTAAAGLETRVQGSIFEDSATKMKVVFIKPQHSYACDLGSHLGTVISDWGCDSVRNLITLRGIDRDISRAREIIKTLDVPIKDVTKRTSQVTKVVRLKYIKLNDDFSRELKTMTSNAYFAGLLINPTAANTINSVVLDPPTNSLVFVGDNYIYERFYNLLKQLDIPSRQKVVKVIPLKYATVDDIRNLEAIETVSGLSDEVVLTFSESTNTITYTGPEDDFERVKKVIDGVDIEERRYVTEVIDLQYVLAGDIKTSEIMNNLSKFPGFGVKAGDCEGCGTVLEYDYQTNSVIISTQQQYLDNVRNLIQSMDQNVFDDYEFEVFRLKYVNAARAIQIMGSLINPDDSDTEYPGNGAFFNIPENFPGGFTYEFESVYTQSYKTVFAPNMADNSIYILSRPQEMEMMRAILRDLDQPNDQLKIDIQIIELTRNDETRFRLAYVTRDGKFSSAGNITDYYNYHNIADVDGNVNDFYEGVYNSTDGTPPNDFEGGFLVYNTVNDFVAGFSTMLDVLVQKVNGRIVANPSVMTPEQRLVTFDFAERIPYTIVSFGQIEVQTARNGIVINIIPHFRDGYILMDLDINVAEVTGYTRQNYPIESARNIVTEVKCEDGIPFIIGGIIKSQETLTRVSLPVLSDLPLVGSLFRKKQRKVEEYEVVMVITPTITKVDF